MATANTAGRHRAGVRAGRHRANERAKRADGLPVRRWLAVGAASTGLGAAFVGAALLGPSTGMASADTGGDSSVSATTSTETPDTSTATPAASMARESARERRAAAESRAEARAEARVQARAERRAERAERVESRQANRAARIEQAEAAIAQRLVRPGGTGTAISSGDTLTTARVFAARRSLISTPTAAPQQLTGQIAGPITGTIGGADPDEDPLTYRLRRAPKEGSVQINSDGTYTYTPDSRFDGVDTFRVVVTDGGFRGTAATATVNQGAIGFDFTFTDGSQYWTTERRAALQDAAENMLLYFVVSRPVTLTYEVVGEDDEGSGTLAGAGSSLTSRSPGFWRTVVQQKVLTGRDMNGDAADGQIAWNFGEDWALGDSVGPDEYDFTSTVMHELLHTFGFLTMIGGPNEFGGPAFTRFDRFVVNQFGTSAFVGYRWKEQYDKNLTGGAGGLYFGGPNAVAAYGGLVPLYTPKQWASGSSMHHLDDATFTGDDQKIMNARSDPGLSVRVLSPVEIGILRDLGYQVVPYTPETSMSAIAFVGVFLLRRRKVSR